MRHQQEAEQAGYQAMQVVAEQQAANVPVTGVTEATNESETPMDVDQGNKGETSGIKRKAEDEPSDESKKARVGAYSFTSRP
jgi:squamous cell carcinoma antigen recognized by T-cells 3